MVNVVMEVCKKELRTRFGSKRVLLPMLIPIGIPTLIFIPKLLEVMSQTDQESEIVRFLLFLILPVMVTTLIGITTFINEIRWKTIKTLLVAPVSEGEIFIGKSLACIISGLVTEAFLSTIIIFSLNIVDYSLLLLLFIIGPLTVIFTTFIFVMGTSRFPTIAEGGGAILMPISGLLIVFTIFFSLRAFFQISPVLSYLTLALIIVILICITYLLGIRWFNRETLLLTI
ncbi:MAG: hypothetical protein ACFFFH_08450 [Candidatus Thorarchaeota archaeon]